MVNKSSVRSRPNFLGGSVGTVVITVDVVIVVVVVVEVDVDDLDDVGSVS